MDNSSHKSGNQFSHVMSFLAGLLLGGLVGTVAMLLLAPRAGEKTRSQITKQGAKLRHQADESIEDFVSEAGDKAHQFTDSVHHGVSELQQHTQDMLAEVRK